MGRGVLAKYKKAADKRNLSYADGDRMNEESLEALCGESQLAVVGETATEAFECRNSEV